MHTGRIITEDIARVLKSIHMNNLLTGLLSSKQDAKQAAWRWVLLEQSTTRVLCCNLQGEMTQSYEIDAQIADLSQLEEYSGNTAVVLGESLVQLMTTGGLNTWLPLPPTQTTLTNRAYCFDESLLTGFATAALIIPFAEWLLQGLQHHEQWCCLYTDRLLLGGKNAMRQWDTDSPYLPISIQHSIEGLEKEQRLHFGDDALPAWLAQLEWETLMPQTLLSSWHTLLHPAR